MTPKFRMCALVNQTFSFDFLYTASDLSQYPYAPCRSTLVSQLQVTLGVRATMLLRASHRPCRLTLPLLPPSSMRDWSILLMMYAREFGPCRPSHIT